MTNEIYLCLFYILMGVIEEIIAAGCRSESGKPCSIDEYLDTNLCACLRCMDLCQHRPDGSTYSECQSHCPDYLRRLNASKVGFNPHENLATPPTHNRTYAALSSALANQVQEDDSLIKKPLFWTSVISVFISVVATGVLVVLCSCKKSQSARRSYIRRLQLSGQSTRSGKGVDLESRCPEDLLKIEKYSDDRRVTPRFDSSIDTCFGNRQAPVEQSFSRGMCVESISAYSPSLGLSYYSNNPFPGSLDNPLHAPVDISLLQQSDSDNYRGSDTTPAKQFSNEFSACPPCNKWENVRVHCQEVTARQCLIESGYVDAGSCTSTTGVVEESLLSSIKTPVSGEKQQLLVEHLLQKTESQTSELNLKLRSSEYLKAPELQGLLDIRTGNCIQETERGNDEETELKSEKSIPTYMNAEPV